jgi:hypothetical protein
VILSRRGWARRAAARAASAEDVDHAFQIVGHGCQSHFGLRSSQTAQQEARVFEDAVFECGEGVFHGRLSQSYRFRRGAILEAAVISCLGSPLSALRSARARYRQSDVRGRCRYSYKCSSRRSRGSYPGCPFSAGSARSTPTPTYPTCTQTPRVLAPLKIAAMVIKCISSRRCSSVRSTRGSRKSVKYFRDSRSPHLTPTRSTRI